MDDQLWNELNNLRVYLQNFNVVELVRAHYAKHGNDAPPSLLKEAIESLDARLTAVYREKSGGG